MARRGQARSCAVASATLNGTVTVNVEPCPGVLVTMMSPPQAATSFRQIARPRPVPPYWRVVDWSACEKASKIVASFSGEIPIPVSFTRDGQHIRPAGRRANRQVNKPMLGELERIVDEIADDLRQP